MPEPRNHLFELAYEVCMTYDHPMFDKYPRLAQCPDLRAVYLELRRFLLAESA